MIDLNRENVTAELEKAVQLKGEDYIYTDEHAKCTYINAGQASCLVGHVLLNLGVSVDRLIEADAFDNDGGMDAGMLLEELKSEGVVKFDPAARDALCWAQVKQDAGDTWGDALYVAKRQYRDYQPLDVWADDF